MLSKHSRCVPGLTPLGCIYTIQSVLLTVLLRGSLMFPQEIPSFVGSAVKTLTGDSVSIPNVICSGRQLIRAEWNTCQEIGSECLCSPPVFHWHEQSVGKASPSLGQTANQNKEMSYGFAARDKCSTHSFATCRLRAFLQDSPCFEAALNNIVQGMLIPQ